jgi:hypothetical protein
MGDPIAPDDIKSHVSTYGSKSVTDTQLLGYVGRETYCRLRRQTPYLWAELTDCTSIQDHPSDVESVILDERASPTTIKRQLIAGYLGVKKTPIVAELEQTSPVVIPLEDYRGIYGLWIIWLFIIISSIVYAFYVLGITQALFTDDHSLLMRLVTP